ncbi:MAG: beta-ketoacyl-[acyl-carrier-protein] synthase family protein [Planctomycetales bacterium]|nr:beta-ketoacyl-[acyl-carrier-protein] synthase family protein [Planctomycetales bacterium]
MEQVFITGLGVACPIGLGLEEVWAAIERGESGIRELKALGAAGWPAPLGGMIPDAEFDPKEWIQPRKSLKVMAREIQLAYASGEMAWTAAGMDEAAVDPDRVGVVLGSGLMYCPPEELAPPYSACMAKGKFQYDLWGPVGMRELYPLWMLKYLPNMSACHIGIRRDARGATNVIAHGDASSLLALQEGAGVITRGAADVMLVGASSSRLNMLDPLWRESAAAWRAGLPPAEACRPFDASRGGAVCGEGAAVIVLEGESHAERRGAARLARIAAIACRNEASTATRTPTGKAIELAIQAAMELADLSPDDLAFVSAHAAGSRVLDAVEARAIHNTLGRVPVTALKSYFGNCGAASGAVELSIAVQALLHGQAPPTLNYSQPDPDCPVNVVAETAPLSKRAALVLNYNAVGQAVAAVVTAA